MNRNREDIDALLGTASVDALLAADAYGAACEIVDGILDNEDVNGPGTYGTWSGADAAIDVYGSHEMAEDDAASEISNALIEVAVGHALTMLSENGGDFDLICALGDLERIDDPAFNDKLEAAIQKRIESDLRGECPWDMIECDARVNLQVQVNGIWIEVNASATDISRISEEARDHYASETEGRGVAWDDLPDAEKSEREEKAALAHVSVALEQGLVAAIARGPDVEKQVQRIRYTAHTVIDAANERLCEAA